MPFIRRFFLLSLGPLLAFSAAQAQECRSVRSFQAVHAKKDKTVRIPDFEGPKDVASVVTVLFKDYLGFAKGLNVSESDGTRLIRGQVVRDGEGYRVAISTDSLKWEGKFLYPERLNDALVDAVDRISRELKSPLPPKKLLPFINTTTSSSAYFLYAQARRALAGPVWGEEALTKAQEALEKAIQADYNYVPAYLVLAKVFAARHRLTGEIGWKNRSLKELQKAKLLLPPLGERCEPEIRWYLEGKAEDVCGGA